ncbi:hypothetical protein KY290_010648 [Solanum tuberosum]|uniref:Uncharacterized protein n=1 Tax=Solanum tuberosum TaxID=4113 RepID=A0ABQ7VYD5_SOLTU|nr:hypothetical protein KY290_010648 [Solanum tuberosum]
MCYITSLTQPNTSFYITTAQLGGGLHYKLYTTGYRLLHYNIPAGRRLYITSFTKQDAGLYIITALPVEGLYIISYFTYITFTTQQKGHQQSTTHYNEEPPLSSKLGQVSAMLSTVNYVKDSL